MLKHRLITAIILIPLFLLALFKLPPGGFSLLITAVVLYAAWEWSRLSGITYPLRRLIFPLIVFLLLPLVLDIPIAVILFIGLVWWLLAAILVIAYPRFSAYWGKSISLRLIMGLFVLIPCWRALNFIRQSEHGIATLLFLFALIWGADSGAYFAGKKWGKHKLLPEVSPGKTWQGLIGALFVTVVLTLGVLYYFAVPLSIWWAAMLLSITTVLFSVLGDLFESMLKRQVDLKDSGSLLPGHGGVLDRIDSLTAAAPVFALGAIGMFWVFSSHS